MPVIPDNYVYLDYAASAPFDTRLTNTLAKSCWGNANSLHTIGRQARVELDEARRFIARSLDAKRPSEIFFTSGASEAINTAIWGLIKPDTNYVVVSSLEHPALRKSVEALRSKNIRIKVLNPNTDGIITPDSLRKVLDDLSDIDAKVGFVAVQAVNGEIGTIQPFSELSKISHEFGILFICDMVQALGKIEFSLQKSDVDIAVFSGHKIGAPIGIGCMYIKAGVNCTPLIRGGGQELGLRSGTSPVALACAFAKEIKYSLSERKHTWDHLFFLRQLLIAKLAQNNNYKMHPTLKSQDNCVPHIISLYSDLFEAQTLLLRFDKEGIGVSSGSACSSKSLDPSYVLTSIGIKLDQANKTIRISFGKGTSAAHIDKFLSVLDKINKQ